MTTLVPETELEQFLQWFSQEEGIPLQVRNDFLAYVLKVGGLDQKGIEFLQKSLEHLQKKSEVQAQVLAKKIENLSDAIACEESPEGSLRKSIVDQAGENMMETAQAFKKEVVETKQVQAQEEEQEERDEEQTAIAEAKQQIEGA